LWSFTDQNITALEQLVLLHYNKFIVYVIKFAYFCVISGGNRYIPASSSGGPSRVNAADPFTGASRYVPSHGSGVSNSVTSVYRIFSFEN
jgi:hypothetical protein